MRAVAVAPLSPAQLDELRVAVTQLERRSFAARLAQITGTPVDVVIKYLPTPINRRLRNMIEAAMLRCLDIAINSLEDTAVEPISDLMGKVLTGISGGIGGFFGMPALPFELPLTTTLMLRSIAEIARDEGEDLHDLDARLACLEVFALGGGGRGSSGRDDGGDLNLQYYAVRSVLSKLTQDVSRYVMERGAINASSPILARFAGELVSRFGFAVSDRFASALVPVIGAFGGAAINVIFTDHFQQVARGHFVVRRLEREHGSTLVRRHYARMAKADRGGFRAGLAAAAD